MRKMRRIKIMALLFLVALSGNIKVKAAQATWEHSGDWMYYVENGYAVIGRYEGTETEVVIPETLGGYTVKKLRWYVFSGTKVTSVTLSSTVEEIEPWAFSAGKDSDHVRLEVYIHTINVDRANKNFTSANGILFSKDKKTLISYPERKTAEEYEILSGVENIHEFAFQYNRYLKKVIFPSSVKKVDYDAFLNCINLEEASLNDGLVELEYDAFRYCEKLRTITIPKTVERLGMAAYFSTTQPMFSGAAQLEAINVHPQNKFYSSIDGVLFDKAQESLYEYPEGKKTASYTIPPTVKTVYKMRANSYLKEVIFSPSVKKIGTQAFFGANSLKKVEMTDSVEEIGEGAFTRCNSLETITIPQNVSFVGESAFEYCNHLKKIIFETRNCIFFQGSNVVPADAVIFGYANSTAHKYAENYGRAFTDIETNEKIEYKYDANKLIGLLPKNSDLAYWEPVFSGSSYRDERGNFTGYVPSIIHEHDTTRKEYIELKRFTDDLVKDCITNKEKIDTISQWVHEHVEYSLGSISGNSIESVYTIFQRLYGNCMCFAQLTNYMLYLEGIPVGTVIIPGHEMGVAFDGERWHVVDSQTGYVGTSMYAGETVDAIVFAAGQLTFDIRGIEGVYLAAVGYDQEDTKGIHNITIPSYVKGIYEMALSGLPEDVVVKGDRGGQVEEYCKKKYKYITYSGSQFSATNIGEDETKKEETDASIKDSHETNKEETDASIKGGHETKKDEIDVSITGKHETKTEEIDAFVTIEAEATEGGIVYGKGKYSKGERVELASFALDDTWLFSGWYVGDRLVSSNKKYRFTASENVKIKAVFEKRLSRQKGYKIVMSKEYGDSYVSIYQVQLRNVNR